jgi:hypothetical protein
MITLKQFMEVVNYRITEGGQYGWNCYGNSAYMLDSWNGDHDGSSFSIVFDTKTQEVFEVQSHDYRRNRAYRLINPNYKFEHDAESANRQVASNEAWDSVNYTDLETEEDWLAKATAILNDVEYDTRVEVPLDLSEEELFQLMKMAHEQDLTLNQFVEQTLRTYITVLKNGQD